MTEEPLAEAACTCRVQGECETCKRWHDKLTELLERKRAMTRPRGERLD
jgi:hypothetical protein